jgi:hypothetical protein
VTGSNEEPGPDSSIDEVRADIEATREQLRETVAALGEKVDVKRRAEQKGAETTAVVRHQGQELGAKARAHPAIPLGAITGARGSACRSALGRRVRAAHRWLRSGGAHLLSPAGQGAAGTQKPVLCAGFRSSR